MFKRLYAATLKTTFRNPVTWICFLTVLLLFIYNLTGEHVEPTTYNFHEKMAGWPHYLLLFPIPLFISAVASVDIMKDKKNRFKDLSKISGTGQFTYYSSKISAYLILGLGATCLLTYLYFFIELFHYEMLANIEYTLVECLWMIAIRCLAYSMAVIPVYISLSICTSLCCRSSVVGILISVAYCFARYYIPSLRIVAIPYEPNFVAEYIYHLPQRVFEYFYCLNTRARPGTAETTVTLPTVLLSYTILAGICAVLLTVGYIVYRNQTD